MNRAASLLSVAALALGVSAHAAWAIDISPGDYTVLPAGTNLALVYGQYVKSDRLDVDNVGKIPNSGLEAAYGIARYVHYSKIGNLPVVAEAILPFGGFDDVHIGGEGQPTKNGLGDLMIGLAAFPIHTSDPQYGTTIGETTYISMPTGAYDPAKVSFGNGTVIVTPQFGLIQGLGHGFLLDASADVALTMDHTEHGVRYSVAPSYQLQALVRYMITPTSTVSFGYSGHFGGKQEVDGVFNGLKTSSHQLRLFASRFVTPTFQVQGMVGADVASEAGFRQGFTGQIRLLRVF